MRFSSVISKFNPNHDRAGRFSTGSTGGNGTKYIDDPTKWGDSGDYVAYRAGDLKTDRGLLSFARTEKYAQAYGTNVEKFIVSVKNPYTVDATGMTPVGAVRKAYMALTGKELKFDSGKRTNKEIWRAADKKMASILEKAGNDALIYKNMGESDELLLVAKNKAQAKSYSEIAKIAVVLKHLQGKHNQKNHAPYKHRNQAWGEKHSLPWKSEYKGKGLAGKYELARLTHDEKAAAAVSHAAGTYKKKPSSITSYPNEMGKAIKTVTSTYGQFADKHLMTAANKVGLKLEQALADPGKFSAGLQTHLKNMSAADIDGMGVVTAKIYAGALGLSTKGAKSDVIAAIKAKMAGEDIPAPKAKTPKQALDETVQATGTKGKAAAKTAASVLAAVHHAEVVAHRVGEPFGSLVLAVAALVLMVAGTAVFWRVKWILLFLFLMVPLPGRIHNMISGPLQGFASTGSVFVLEAFGVRVSQQGNVVTLDQRIPMGVAEACSGLRMLTAFIIVAVFVAYMVKRPRWQKAVLVISSIPVAVLCNVLRIVATAVLFLHASSEVAEKFFHDFAGLVMMPAAVMLMFGQLWIMAMLTVPEDKPPQKAVVIGRRKPRGQ